MSVLTIRCLDLMKDRCPMCSTGLLLYDLPLAGEARVECSFCHSRYPRWVNADVTLEGDKVVKVNKFLWGEGRGVPLLPAPKEKEEAAEERLNDPYSAYVWGLEGSTLICSRKHHEEADAP